MSVDRGRCCRKEGRCGQWVWKEIGKEVRGCGGASRSKNHAMLVRSLSLDVSAQSGSYSQVRASVELIGVTSLPDRAGSELESPVSVRSSERNTGAEVEGVNYWRSCLF